MSSYRESLKNIIQYSITEVYKKIVILSQTLPGKSDIDRKLEIVKFAKETRSLFFRLLAVTKWSLSCSEFDEIEKTLNLINEQSSYFTDTADKFFFISKVHLPSTLVPLSCVPVAADILSTQNFNRLPHCIANCNEIANFNATIPNHELHDIFRASFIEIISCTSALALFDLIQIKSDFIRLSIKNMFIVDVATLCSSTGPWKIINLNILISNPQEQSTALVHSDQIKFLIRFIDIKMNDSKDPFKTLNYILTRFCNSLVLEVLYNQAQKLHYLTGAKFTVESFKSHTSLVMSYWRETESIEKTGCKLSFEPDSSTNRGICITHEPPIECLSALKYINSSAINILEIVLKCTSSRLSTYFIELRKQLILEFPSLENSLILKNNNQYLIFKPMIKTFESLFLNLKIDILTGILNITSTLYKEFSSIFLPSVNLHSDASVFVRLFKDYQLFICLYNIKTVMPEYKSNWLRISLGVENKSETNNMEKNSVVRRLHKLGEIYLAFPSVTSSVALTIITAHTNNNQNYTYEIILLRPNFYEKPIGLCQDLYLRTIIRDSLLLDTCQLQDIPFLKYENLKFRGISGSLTYLIHKSYLFTFAFKLRDEKWDLSFRELNAQYSCENISLKSFFLHNTKNTTYKSVLEKFLTDAVFHYDIYLKNGVVDFYFYTDLLKSNVKIEPRCRIIISAYSDPVKLLLKHWKHFVGYFIKFISIYNLPELMDKIIQLSLSFTNLSIYFGNSTYRYEIKLSHYPEKRFLLYSRCGYANPQALGILYKMYKEFNIKELGFAYLVKILVESYHNIRSLMLLPQSVLYGVTSRFFTLSMNFQIFPISLAAFSISFKNTFTLNIKMEDKHQVYVSDDYKYIPSPSNVDLVRDKITKETSLLKLLPIGHLEQFLIYFSESINEEISKSKSNTFLITHKLFHLIINPIDVTYMNKYSRNFSLTSSPLKIFLDSLYFIKSVMDCLKIPAPQNTDQSYFQLQHKLNKLEFKLGISFYLKPLTYLSFKITALDLVEFAEETINILEEYFEKIIITLPHSYTSVFQYFTMLTANTSFIKDFAKVLQMELKPDPMSHWYVEWRHKPYPNSPHRLSPFQAYSIVQSTKYIIMIDVVAVASRDMYITCILTIDPEKDKLIDISLSPGGVWTNRRAETANLNAYVREKLKLKMIAQPTLTSAAYFTINTVLESIGHPSEVFTHSIP